MSVDHSSPDRFLDGSAPANPEAAARYLAVVAAQLYVQDGVVATMDAAARRAVEAVEGSAATGVLSTSRRFRRDVAVSTTQEAERLDALQFRLGDGPSLRAVQERTAVFVRDTRGECRWPLWASVASEAGFQSMLVVPMVIEPYRAALGIYWDCHGRPGHEELAMVSLIARHAAIAVANAHQVSTLREAVEARHRIGLAQGILMERFGLDAEQSFSILRRYSRDNNIKVNDIARAVVTTGYLPGWSAAEPPPDTR
ncbi:GAF and ANTAR domain-containing protein [Jiangella asiatica]|uniref:GAF and ANTAR domain-containing protein n=1 Tax=Jiangella asiatica TaxID=2530372 RepID=UPI0013A5BE95|nr:GAF and ANTAR domain-containing protein [Jiangella asiatica]